MTRAGAFGVWALAMAWSLFGCSAADSGPIGNPGSRRVADLENDLRSKPSFEAARLAYVAATDGMAARIAALAPGATWKVDENSWNGCGGVYTWTGAVQVYYRLVFDRPIPDELWSMAVRIVKDGAAPFGAATVTVLVDRPWDKDLTIAGAGAQFQLGTRVGSVLAATSDCRIRDTARVSKPTLMVTYLR